MAKKQRKVDIRKALRIVAAQKGFDSVAELGRETKVGEGTVGHWLSGGRRPSLGNLERLATLLDMPVSDLVRLGE